MQVGSWRPRRDKSKAQTLQKRYSAKEGKEKERPKYPYPTDIISNSSSTGPTRGTTTSDTSPISAGLSFSSSSLLQLNYLISTFPFVPYRPELSTERHLSSSTHHSDNPATHTYSVPEKSCYNGTDLNRVNEWLRSQIQQLNFTASDSILSLPANPVSASKLDKLFDQIHRYQDGNVRSDELIDILSLAGATPESANSMVDGFFRKLAVHQGGNVSASPAGVDTSIPGWYFYSEFIRVCMFKCMRHLQGKYSRESRISFAEFAEV